MKPNVALIRGDCSFCLGVALAFVLIGTLGCAPLDASSDFTGSAKLPSDGVKLEPYRLDCGNPKEEDLVFDVPGRFQNSVTIELLGCPKVFQLGQSGEEISAQMSAPAPLKLRVSFDKSIAYNLHWSATYIDPEKRLPSSMQHKLGENELLSNTSETKSLPRVSGRTQVYVSLQLVARPISVKLNCDEPWGKYEPPDLADKPKRFFSKAAATLELTGCPNSPADGVPESLEHDGPMKLRVESGPSTDYYLNWTARLLDDAGSGEITLDRVFASKFNSNNMPASQLEVTNLPGASSSAEVLINLKWVSVPKPPNLCTIPSSE